MYGRISLDGLREPRKTFGRYDTQQTCDDLNLTPLEYTNYVCVYVIRYIVLSYLLNEFWLLRTGGSELGRRAWLGGELPLLLEVSQCVGPYYNVS